MCLIRSSNPEDFLISIHTIFSRYCLSNRIKAQKKMMELKKTIKIHKKNIVLIIQYIIFLQKDYSQNNYLPNLLMI